MELTKEQMERQIKLLNLLKNNIEQYESLQQQINKDRIAESTWRNTNLYFWHKITEHYNSEFLLNCYGDIFYIEEKEVDGDDTRYVGRRILWNFNLSQERYEIFETKERYDDGEIDYVNYEINVLVD